MRPSVGGPIDHCPERPRVFAGSCPTAQSETSLSGPGGCLQAVEVFTWHIARADELDHAQNFGHWRQFV